MCKIKLKRKKCGFAVLKDFCANQFDIFMKTACENVQKITKHFVNILATFFAKKNKCRLFLCFIAKKSKNVSVTCETKEEFFKRHIDDMRNLLTRAKNLVFPKFLVFAQIFAKIFVSFLLLCTYHEVVTDNPLMTEDIIMRSVSIRIFQD